MLLRGGGGGARGWQLFAKKGTNNVKRVDWKEERTGKSRRGFLVQSTREV